MTWLALAIALADPGSTIEGLWMNPAESVVIAIAPCGETLCGTVVWATEQAKRDARKGTDTLVGSALLTRLKPTGPGRWRGTLFVPDLDRRVTAKVTQKADGELVVSGCAVGRSLCKSQTWDRVDRVPGS